MFVFIVIGATILSLLGVLHLAATLSSSPQAGGMTPTDPAVVAAMQRPGGIGLDPSLELPLWRPWIGFNLSHSIGAILLGGVIAVPALRDVEAAVSDPIWLAVALLVPPTLIVVSMRYWFTKPTQGITLATICIWVGVIAERV